MIRFYNNYNPITDNLIPGVNYVEKSYGQPIEDMQKKDLIFGRYYSGYIDEIYIIDEMYNP